MSRVGNFSSSQIYKLMSKGRGAFSIENVGSSFSTYVRHKKWERKLGRSFNKDVNSKPTSWGTLVEKQAFDKMGLKYVLKSKDRYYHETHSEYWSGMPDLLTDDVVGDIKCPYTFESFVTMLEVIEAQDIEYFKQVKPDYYWQLVSNAILCDRPKALFVVYMPYLSEISEIKEMTELTIEEDQNKYAWINWASDEELPYLHDEMGVKNLNMFQFDVPEEDKQLLEQRVELAIKYLNNE